MPSTLPHSPLLVPVSPAELLDKKTILEIKQARIADAAQRANVEHELELLAAIAGTLPASAELQGLEAELKEINGSIWDLENRVRQHERSAEFGDEFVRTARTIYSTNDRRAAVKRRINALLQSPIVEEKSHS